MTSRLKRVGSCAAALLMVSAGAASAETILVFGGDGNSAVVASNPTVSTTAITAVDAPVSITALFGAPFPLPISAYLNLNLSSNSVALNIFNSLVQRFFGMFSVTADPGGQGTDYLSGNFSDIVSGGGTGLSLSASDGSVGESVTFVSDVVPANYLSLPRSVNLSFANVTPAALLTGPALRYTLAPFTSSVAGDFSASTSSDVGSGTPLPEPSSVALLGVVMLGVGLARLRFGVRQLGAIFSEQRLGLVTRTRPNNAVPAYRTKSRGRYLPRG